MRVFLLAAALKVKHYNVSRITKPPPPPRTLRDALIHICRVCVCVSIRVGPRLHRAAWVGNKRRRSRPEKLQRNESRVDAPQKKKKRPRRRKVPRHFKKWEAANEMRCVTVPGASVRVSLGFRWGFLLSARWASFFFSPRFRAAMKCFARR